MRNSFFSVRAGRENKRTIKGEKKKVIKSPTTHVFLSLQELQCCYSATSFQCSGRKRCGRTLTSLQFCLPALHAYTSQWCAEALHPLIAWRMKAHLQTRKTGKSSGWRSPEQQLCTFILWHKWQVLVSPCYILWDVVKFSPAQKSSMASTHYLIGSIQTFPVLLCRVNFFSRVSYIQSFISPHAIVYDKLHFK